MDKSREDRDCEQEEKRDRWKCSFVKAVFELTFLFLEVFVFFHFLSFLPPSLHCTFNITRPVLSYSFTLPSLLLTNSRSFNYDALLQPPPLNCRSPAGCNGNNSHSRQA